MSRHNRHKHTAASKHNKTSPGDILDGFGLLLNAISNISYPASPRLYFDAWMVEQDCDYTVFVKLSGFERDDVRIEYKGNILTVSAYKKTQNIFSNNYAQSLSYMSNIYNRSFMIDKISVDKIISSYNNGLLVLKLPKVTKIDTGTDGNGISRHKP
ncbi:18 kDa heat shock protein [Oxobacter pfennigii]|uniref:18 kDa heat shock protein n=1 Tax=Oxobacter pfennigii TaxID=36849 RepID=A0A0N8NT18_9CLOT|nr:Hsp20/alpha crystallin family protein [Oxobacter pfennigii]KPU43592.1 18 kDa heat shock protein [Oxobacter pfennigii]